MSAPVSGHFITPNRCLLYPQKRTWFGAIMMSALCQKQTLGVLFDHPFCAERVHNFRCADDLPRVISHGRYCQRNHHETSVFALAHSFKMVGALAAADSAQNFNFLIQEIRWDQDCN